MREPLSWEALLWACLAVGHGGFAVWWLRQGYWWLVPWFGLMAWQATVKAVELWRQE